ncbi:MAG: F-actin-capping protein subunit alpha [Peltula sp. TS41687]|nr:MAG: F-actin-capping protein subunit alpha [Peltula sp. TS41687]
MRLKLADIVADIQALTSDTNPQSLETFGPAFEKYHHAQLTTVKLPGGSGGREVIVSEYNVLEEVEEEDEEEEEEDGIGGRGRTRYYDIESRALFAYDHVTQKLVVVLILCCFGKKKASSPRSYVMVSQNGDLVKSLLRQLSTHAKEHYPSASYGVYPVKKDSAVAILLVANKYSPNNFWNGRWRSQYIYSPTDSSLKGKIQVDVHYYENGNVRLLTNKPVDDNLSSSSSAASANEIIRQIASVERRCHEELNRAFINLSEGAFRGLRRQLPITRQKIEWEKISSYRVGQDLGGGRGGR